MTNNKNDWREEFDKFVIRLGNELPIIEEADDGDIERWLTECKAFIAQTRKDAVEEALEDIAEKIEKDLYEQESGKIYSKVAAKCLEAPFPEVAIEHAFKRLRERSASIIRQFKDSL